MNYLHDFSHGLGDCTQFTAVLAHLKAREPDSQHWMKVRDSGKASLYRGLAETGLAPAEARRFSYHWPECRQTWKDSPATKTAKCLREVFQIQPQWDLLRYSCPVREEVRNTVRDRLRGFGRPCVGLHLKGNTSQTNKDIPDTDARILCDWLWEQGICPVIMDWDNRTTFLRDAFRIAPIPGDAEHIAALVSECKLFIGCDSGPQKVAFATPTPVLAVWWKHHPIHYADNTPNAMHLLPVDHHRLIHGDTKTGCDYFDAHYRYTTFPWKDGQLARSMIACAEQLLSSKTTFKDELRQVFLGKDMRDFDLWADRYVKLYQEIQTIKPSLIVEIGVRAGYSSWTMLQAAPESRIIAFDANIDPTLGNSHGGFLDAYQHAETICQGRLDLVLVDSHQLQRLPRADVVFVDGDHTPEGCYQDIELAARTARVILLDDYDTVFHSTGTARYEVREAVDKWVSVNAAKIAGTKHIPNGSTGMFRIDLHLHT